MKDKLMPQEKRSSAVIIQMNQSSEEIEQQAEKASRPMSRYYEPSKYDLWHKMRKS